VSSLRPRVVYTAGVFDLLHSGHIQTLKQSRALGDLLVVGVLTDLGAAAYKPKPPVYNEHARLEIIRSLSFVDVALLQAGTDPSDNLRALVTLGMRPEIMTHGNDWTELREGNETLSQLGVELVLLQNIPNLSTSRVRARLEEEGRARVEVTFKEAEPDPLLKALP